LINHSLEQKIGKSIQFKGGSKLSYLAFANDLLLFAKVNLEHVDAMKKILDNFYTSLGQKVNVDKIGIFLFTNTHSNIRDDIIHKLDFQRMMDLGKYLGVPLHHDKVSKQNHHLLLTKLIKG